MSTVIASKDMDARSQTKRVAIVTGSASGIGLATALRLISDGFHVVAMDLDKTGLRTLAEKSQSVTTVSIDLADLNTIEPTVAGIITQLGVPEVLINAAGVSQVATLLETNLAAWQRVIDINLTAPMLMCRAVVPAMIEAGGGAIVNIASVAAFRGVRSRVTYCAAKAGLVGLTRAMTADFAGQGIRVNAICPGTVETGYTQAVLAVAEDAEETRKFMTDRQLIGRMGTPEEIASAVSFLVSSEASFFHGSAVIIDGGRSVM